MPFDPGIAAFLRGFDAYDYPEVLAENALYFVSVNPSTDLRSPKKREKIV